MSTTRPVTARAGLVLAALLAVYGLVTFIPLFAEGIPLPLALVSLNALALVAIPFAWRGAVWARNLVIVATVLPTLSGVPAFFIPDIPTEAIVAVSTGIVLALVVTVLLLTAPRPVR